MLFFSFLVIYLAHFFLDRLEQQIAETFSVTVVIGDGVKRVVSELCLDDTFFIVLTVFSKGVFNILDIAGYLGLFVLKKLLILFKSGSDREPCSCCR